MEHGQKHNDKEFFMLTLNKLIVAVYYLFGYGMPVLIMIGVVYDISNGRLGLAAGILILLVLGYCTRWYWKKLDE